MSLVHYFHSGMQGAPTITGTAGALIGLLDAVLVDGFGQLNVTSLVVASGVATATFSGGHSYKTHSVLTLAGATPAGLNGNKKVLSVGGSSVTFAAPGVTDGAAAGAITARVAALGWEKAFSSANKAVYRSLDPESFGMLLRVDDSHSTQPRVRGFEAMTDVDTGTGLFPTLIQQPDAGGWWPKSFEANLTVRPWLIVGDSRAFYLHVHTGNNPYSGWGVYFGDVVPDNSTDQFACGLIAGGADYNNYGSSTPFSDFARVTGSMTNGGWNSNALTVPRDYHGLGTAVHNGLIAECAGSTDTSGSGGWTWPNPVSNRLFVTGVMVTTTGNRRGRLPGFWHTPFNVAAYGTFQTRDEVPDFDGGLAGRTLVAARSGYQYTNTLSGGAVSFLDVTGPWR